MNLSVSEDTRESSNDISARLLQVVQELTAEIRPRHLASQPVTLDSSLIRDLGLDSLARMELLSRIEQRFTVTLPEKTFIEAETPRDLLRSVISAGAPGKPLEILAPGVPLMGEAEAAPATTQTLIDVLQWHVMTHPDRIHIRFYSDTDEGESLSYQQLWLGAKRIAASLQQVGLQTGEMVAIMLPTGKEYFYSFFGILMAGGIPVPIYPPVRRSQLEEHLRRHGGILSNCQATMLITFAEAKQVAHLLKLQVGTLTHILTLDELTADPHTLTMPGRGAQDIAMLQYTSGSTGNPKGVVLTHANLLANVRAMGAVVQADSSDVFVSWLPLYHDMGLIGAWLGSLYYAATFVVMPPFSFLARPQRWLQAIHRYGGTLSASPNFGYELCLRRLEDTDLQGLDLSSWRAAFNGAEAVSPNTMLNFYERFKAYGLRSETLMPVYGLAECSVGLAFPPLDHGLIIDRIQRQAFMRSGRAIPAEETEQHVLSFVASGQTLPGHQIRIVDLTGNEAPERAEGRLQFQGPSATSGYYRNREATCGLFDGPWLDSGDLAYMAEGDIYITGRSKDIIIRAGRNIYPDELEEAVGDIPGIRKGRVAAFASKDPDSATERLVLVAETREQGAERLAQLRSQINEVITDLVELPADEVILAPPNSVLKTSSGKIRRAASRERYESGRIDKPQKTFVWQSVSLLLAGLRPQLRRLWQSMSAIAYGAYARSIFWILAPIVWLMVAVLPYPSWRWAVMRAGSRTLARAVGTDIKVRGLEHLPAAEQPCVYVANHGSYLDGPILIASFKRQFSFVAKVELLKSFVSRIFLRRIQSEFVERFEQQKGIIDAQRLATYAQQGQSLMFFPEGTFSRTAGLLPFHMGAYIAAAEAKVPIVPVAIRGARSILRGNTWLPRHGGLTITFGKAIYPDDVRDQTTDSTWMIALKMHDASREFILNHCGEPDLAGERPAI